MLRNNAKILLAILALFVGATTRSWAVEINYTVKTEGAVSLAVYDIKGHLVRTLFSGKKQKSGSYTTEWDGTDQEGAKVPPGEYRLKGLTANIGWEYLLTMGASGNPPKTTPDGTGGWGGLNHNVVGVACVQSNVYLAWYGEEGAPAVLNIQVDKDGNKSPIRWGAHGVFGNTQADIATDGEYVYILLDKELTDAKTKVPLRQAMVWRANAKTGDYAWYPDKSRQWPVCGEPVALKEGRYPGQATLLEMASNVATRRYPLLAWAGRALDVDGQYLYVTLFYENRIAVMDKKTGDVVRYIDNIIKPCGISCDNGILYVVSEDRVLKIDAAGMAQEWKAVPDAYGIEVRNGRVVITCLGATMNVQEYTLDGTLRHSIGRKGGRPFCGNWAKTKDDFLFPLNPGIDGNGLIYVGEDAAPKRQAIIKNGKIIQNWYGTCNSGCSQGVAVDPDNPGLVYSQSDLMGPGNLVRYRINYRKRMGDIDAYWTGINGISPNTLQPNTITQGSCCMRVIGFKGRKYLTFGTGTHPIFRIEGDILIPCAAIGSGTPPASAFPSPEDMRKIQEKSQARSADYYIWRDINGDGMAQAEELEFGFGRLTKLSHDVPGAFYDDELNLYVPDNYGIAGNICKFTCTGIDATGNPVFATEPTVVVRSATLFTMPRSRVEAGKDGNIPAYAGFCYPDMKNGLIYATAYYRHQDKGIGWASSFLDDRIGAYNMQGELMWKTPNGSKATGFAKPGQFYFAGGMTGTLGDFAFFEDICGQVRVFDKQGLFVGNILEDPYRGAIPGPNAIWVELSGGSCIYRDKNGWVYACIGDQYGVHFYRITGLEKIRYFDGAVTLK